MSPTMWLNRTDENYFSATLVLFEERLKFLRRLVKLQAKLSQLEWQLKNFKHHLMTIISSEENKMCIELISRTSIIPRYMLELICKDRTRLRLFQNIWQQRLWKSIKNFWQKFREKLWRHLWTTYRVPTYSEYSLMKMNKIKIKLTYFWKQFLLLKSCGLYFFTWSFGSRY